MMRRFRVIQGGKQEKGEAPESPVKLYKAHSVGNLTRGEEVYHDVRFNWYCLEREFSTIPYEDLITGYDELDDKHRELLMREITRYFTEEEIATFQNYLWERYGMEVLTEEVSLPIKERGFLFEEGSSVIYDFLDLSEKENYSMPFKVWGYYTIQNCLSSPSLDKGVEFLNKAFELLGVDSGVGREQLESAVKAIYEKEGLIVKAKETS